MVKMIDFCKRLILTDTLAITPRITDKCVTNCVIHKPSTFTQNVTLNEALKGPIILR